MLHGFFTRGRDNHSFFNILGTVFQTQTFQGWADKYNQLLVDLEQPSQDPNFKVLERTNAAIAGTLSTLKAKQEDTARKVEHLMKVTEATGGTVTSSSKQLNELYRFQQYAALHKMQTASYASSLPPFDPNKSYHWPAVNVQQIRINAVTPSPPAVHANICPDVEVQHLERQNVQQLLPDDPPKVFRHCHNGSYEVMKDYLGQGDSIFSCYGGMKTLRNDSKWYRDLRPTKKENETAKSYVRRICLAGERIQALIERDMVSHCSTFDESMVRVCKSVDQVASERSKNKRYISLTKIIEALGSIGDNRNSL